MEYDKPFRTYNELIVKMESKGIIVKDKDFAKEVLSNCSYYNLINRYKNVFTNHTNGDKFYVKHHNHVPPWILVTSLSFGVTKQWYSILRATDKTRVVNSFIGSSSLTDEEKKEYLKTSIDLIRNYRNAIAHGGKTTGISVKRIPKKQSILLSNGLISEEDFRNGSITHSGVQTVICILLSLINDHYIENALIQDIMNLFWPYKVNDNDRFGKGIWDDLGLSGKFLNELIKIYKGE